MRKYEFLDHTADAKFRAYGKNLEQAFTNAALALTNLVTDSAKVKPNIKHIFSNDDTKPLIAIMFKTNDSTDDTFTD